MTDNQTTKTIKTAADILIMRGEQKGLQKGLQQARLETAFKMLLEGFSDDVILRITSITQKQLDELKRKLKK